MYTTGSNLVWSQFSHVINSVTRDATNFNMHLVGGSNNRIDTVMYVGGDGGGIFQDGTKGDIDTNNGAFNTLADSNYHTDGATNSTTDHSYVYNAGDDSDSNVSYSGEPGGPVNGSLVQWNNISTNTLGRGMTVPGGENMTFQDNLVQALTGAAGIYIAQETPSPYGESGVSNIVARYNYILNGSGPHTAQPCILLYAANPSGPGITNVSILGNYIVNCNEPGLGTFESGGYAVSDISFISNTVTGSNGMWNSNGTPTNVLCTNNTYNGVNNTSGSACSNTATGSTATGSPLASSPYSGCVVGTAKQYTGPITLTSPATVKAVAVFPGLANSSVGSASYTSGPAAATPTRR
jgi:hypothetical protein